MATYPLPTLAAQVTATGISAPSYADIFESLKASARNIFGPDLYLEEDSQDGQLLAVFALAIHDANQTAVTVYNSFSPQTAQGVGLSNVVKINNIKRAAASNSQVLLELTGVAGTTINTGVVSDAFGNKWNLPGVVVIPPAGTTTVTATAQEQGALSTGIGTITQIVTPVAGWQTVTNPAVPSPGQAVESDAELRARQEIAPALNSYTVLDGLTSNLEALTGVDYVRVYENDTNATDSMGLPAHSIAAVVRGGDLQDIVETIYKLKGPGVYTHGTTSGTVTDMSGTVHTIRYFEPTEEPIKVVINITALTNYTSVTGDRIKQALVDYVNGMDVGEDLVVNRLYTPALLNGDQINETYKITSLTASLSSGTPGTADVPIAFNEKAISDLSQITLNVTV